VVRLLACAAVVAGLALLQLLISATPTLLTPSGNGRPLARAYRVDDVTPYGLRITLFEPGSQILAGAVKLLPVARGEIAQPPRDPGWILPIGMKQVVLQVHFSAPAATYKLVLPGVDPFGDVSVRRL